MRVGDQSRPLKGGLVEGWQGLGNLATLYRKKKTSPKHIYKGVIIIIIIMYINVLNRTKNEITMIGFKI